MNTIVWMLLWVIVGWLTGILAYFTGGLFALLPQCEDDLRNTVANYYSKMAMKLLGRSALVERGTKFDIFRTSHDADKNADKVTIDGNTGHVSNETGLLSVLHKQPFGLVPPPEEDIGVYVSPEIAELGRVETERREQGTLRNDGGGYEYNVSLPERRPLVKLRENARRIVRGCRSLWDLDETVELYQQSQSGFVSTQTQQFMILIVAYGAGALLTWLIVTNAGGAAPTGISVPGMG